MDMIIVAGTFDMAPEDREAFLSSRAEAIERSRGEDGCLEYSFAADSVDPGRVRLFEIWESREHLGEHQNVMRAAPANPNAVAVHERRVSYYEIASVEPSDLPNPSR